MSDFVKGFELYEIKDEKETAEKIFNSLTDKAKKDFGLGLCYEYIDRSKSEQLKNDAVDLLKNKNTLDDEDLFILGFYYTYAGDQKKVWIFC